LPGDAEVTNVPMGLDRVGAALALGLGVRVEMDATLGLGLGVRVGVDATLALGLGVRV
jgi:hypothetical protein